MQHITSHRPSATATTLIALLALLIAVGDSIRGLNATASDTANPASVDVEPAANLPRTLIIVTAEAELEKAKLVQLFVACPKGYTVFSGGVFLKQRGSFAAWLLASEPYFQDGFEGWRGAARNPQIYSKADELRVSVICAKVGNPVVP